MCETLYSMHTDTPLIKAMEEHNERILDADYTTVDTPTMVNALDISDESKQNLQRRLEKLGLGCLNHQKPTSMKLKKEQNRTHSGITQYQRRTTTQRRRKLIGSWTLEYCNDSHGTMILSGQRRLSWTRRKHGIYVW